MIQSSSTILHIFEDGLILRRSTEADAEKLAEFNSRIHAETPAPDLKVGAWTSDLLQGGHPTFKADDFTVVEDPKTGKIVSSLSLISQTWTYAGIPFKVGRPELVGTDPEYRTRGLIRSQFKIIHEWSRQRGELVQGITGIPFYYRLFGYEMAMDLRSGRAGFAQQVPKLEKDKTEEYTIRPALEKDLSFISTLYSQGSQRSLVTAVRDLPLWKYELSGKSSQSYSHFELRVISSLDGEPVGYLAHPWFLWPSTLGCISYELKPGTSWYYVTPAVIRYLWQTGQDYARLEGKEHSAFGFWLSSNHPVYEVAKERLPRIRQPYAWFLRVPDLSGFLRLVAPALEKRLEASACSGFSGEITVGFYQSGLKLNFEAGRLALVEPWQPQPNIFGKVTFPGLTFLQLLFGYRSLDELMVAFADCACIDDLKPVMRSLFPRQASDVWPID